jgi:hypothetical protein
MEPAILKGSRAQARCTAMYRKSALGAYEQQKKIGLVHGSQSLRRIGRQCFPVRDEVL